MPFTINHVFDLRNWTAVDYLCEITAVDLGVADVVTDQVKNLISDRFIKTQVDVFADHNNDGSKWF